MEGAPPNQPPEADRGLSVFLTLPIEPHAKMRPRTFSVGGKVRTVTPSKTTRWENRLAALAAEYMPTSSIDIPVRVDVAAILRRPQGLMRKRDPAGLIWCPKRPDADNIRKATLDALARYWRDDSLVVAGDTLKLYAEKNGLPRMVIGITEPGEPGLVYGSLFCDPLGGL